MRRTISSHPEPDSTTFSTLLFYTGLVGFVVLTSFSTPLIQLLAD
ncbi:hypothetical protein [Hymenobacter nitidus]|nr:hypothetical protein [Hymenobacter nitidus]